MSAWAAGAGARCQDAVLLPGDDDLHRRPARPDPASGLPPSARAVPPTRCPVCGMFPARAPQWAAQIIFSNGDAHFFDSPLSLFMYLRRWRATAPAAAAGHRCPLRADASAPPDASAAWIDARAFYVHGSSPKGPMRAGNLPAFATRRGQDAFAERRGGVVLAFVPSTPRWSPLWPAAAGIAITTEFAPKNSCQRFTP